MGEFLRSQFVKDLAVVLAIVPWLVVPGWQVYRWLSPDIRALAIPICERFPLLPTTDDGSGAVTLLGVNIYAFDDVRDVQVRFSDLFHVLQWGMYSDGLSASAREEFMSMFPHGTTPSFYVTPAIPLLPAGSTVTLTAMSVAPIGLDCRARRTDWLEVLSSSERIFHANATAVAFREYPGFSFAPLAVVVAAYVLVFVAGITMYRRWP